MRNNKAVKLIATDLDGTLLKDDKSISPCDRNTLERAGNKGITRVVATGRNLFKVNEVLPADLPVDYVVFSSGEGIYDWKNKKLLHSVQFGKETVRKLCRHLLSGDYNFFVYRPIPDNNLFYFHQGAGKCMEYANYLEKHKGNFMPLNTKSLPEESGQMMAIIPNDDRLFEQLEAEIYHNCEKIKIIRSTSPVNPAYTWLEIFPETVSKGNGLKWLCANLTISREYTVGIGNDYNDRDMFRFVAFPYLLDNGVKPLKKQFNTVGASNNESGFSVVAELFDI